MVKSMENMILSQSMKTDLNAIAAVLEGLEETILHRIIDRGQYLVNCRIYEPGLSGFEGGGDSSLLELRLKRQEVMDSEFGRFTVPEERPFNSGLSKPRRVINLPDNPLHIDDYDRINLCQEILSAYCGSLESFCKPGDDGQYGSSVELDVSALQAISRRIHYGAFYVAESKFSGDRDTYTALVRAGNITEIETLLTRREVEVKILERLRQKVDTIQGKINTLVRRRIDPDAIIAFYRDYIIPLTKKGEILYMIRRSDS